MDILSKIKQPIEGELIQLNEVIVQILSSTSPLLSRIVDHYLSMKGKQKTYPRFAYGSSCR